MASPNDFFGTPTPYLHPTSYSSPINLQPQVPPQQNNLPQPSFQNYSSQQQHPIFEQTSNRIPSALQQATTPASPHSNGSNINIMSLVGPNMKITSYTSSKQQPNNTNTAAQNNPRNVNTAIFQQIHSVVESMQEKEKQQQAQFEKQILQMIMQQKQRQQQYQQQQQKQQQPVPAQKSGPIYAAPQLTTSAPLYHPYQRPATAAAPKPSLPRVASEEFLNLNQLLATPPPPPAPTSPISSQISQPSIATPVLQESNPTNALTAEQQQQLLFQQLMGIQPDPNGTSNGMSNSLFEDLGDSNFLDSLLGNNSNL